jgi:hypothetical protein
MKTAITYALLSFVMLICATVLGRFLFTAIDHAVHAVSLILNVN